MAPVPEGGRRGGYGRGGAGDRFLNDDANRLLTRPMRSPWCL